MVVKGPAVPEVQQSRESKISDRQEMIRQGVKGWFQELTQSKRESAAECGSKARMWVRAQKRIQGAYLGPVCAQYGGIMQNWSKVDQA
eukprot:4421727-Karenia_brevis.AAC.1